MSDIEVDDFSHLTTVCPNTVLDQLSVVLSKAVEESISSDQWLYRSLCFLQNNDSNLEQSLSTGDLIEYNNPPGFLNGRAIFLCVSQHNRLYEEELFNSLDNAFYTHTVDIGSHQNLFEELLSEILKENNESAQQSTVDVDTPADPSSTIDAPKMARDVHDIVSEYLIVKMIKIEDLVIVTPFWPTMSTLNSQLLSPVSPMHPHRPCSIDFTQYGEIFQLIGMSLIVAYVSNTGNGMEKCIAQASKLATSDLFKQAPEIKRVEYSMDNSNKTIIPALLNIYYTNLNASSEATNTVPLAIDLTNDGENDGVGEESGTNKSAIKKNKTDYVDENQSTSVRKSGRCRKQPSSSYEDNFTAQFKQTTKQPKANQNAELLKKKPAARISKKRKNNKSFVDFTYDDNYSTDLYYNDNSTVEADEQQKSARLLYQPPCSIGGKLDSNKFKSPAVTSSDNNTVAIVAATTTGGSSSMITEEQHEIKMLKQKLSLIEDFHKREDDINTKNENTFTRWMTKGIDNFERFNQIQRATAIPQSTAASSEMQLSSAIGSSGSMMNNNLNSSSSTTASLFSSPLLVAAAAQQLQQQQIQNQLLLLSQQHENKLHSKDKVKKKKKKEKKAKKAKKSSKSKKKSKRSKEKEKKDNSRRSSSGHAQDLRDLALLSARVLQQQVIPGVESAASTSSKKRKRSRSSSSSSSSTSSSSTSSSSTSGSSSSSTSTNT